MLTAWYIGDHSEDDWLSRLGYRVIRIGQTAERFGYATHCEGITEGTWDNCTIWGASRRDGKKVRSKSTALTPGNWRILDVPAWDVEQFKARAVTLRGIKYSDFGAAASASMAVRLVASVLRIDIAGLGQWCSRFLAQANDIEGAEDMSVSELMALAMALYGTRDVTGEFFATKQG